VGRLAGSRSPAAAAFLLSASSGRLVSLAQVAGNMASPAPSSSARPAPSPSSQQRRGKWSPEEEAYAARLIHAFDAGVLASA